MKRGIHSWWALTFSLLAHCAVPSLEAKDVVQWTTNYYSVTGATLVEIRQSIRQSRPWRSRVELDGLTAWRVEWSFSVVATQTGCRCSAFSTRTEIQTTVPRWMGSPNATTSLVGTWNLYSAALGRHEAGHGQNAVAAAGELRRRVQALGERTTCEDLKLAIDSIGQQTLDEFRQRDKAYDERTRHGATEGAIFPGRDRRRPGD